MLLVVSYLLFFVAGCFIRIVVVLNHRGRDGVDLLERVDARDEQDRGQDRQGGMVASRFSNSASQTHTPWQGESPGKWDFTSIINFGRKIKYRNNVSLSLSIPVEDAARRARYSRRQVPPVRCPLAA